MQAIPTEMALYTGLVLITLWIAYRLYLSNYFQTNEGFSNSVSTTHSFVMYYADWCGHCKRAKPEFAKLGSKRTIGGKPVSIVAVNADKNKELCSAKGVRGYPTIHLYDPKGTLIEEYSGERDAKSFLDFLSLNVK